MTPMSDVMVLLLTFFMLTATFVKEEPVKVQTPGSVSEIKIPETNLLTVFIDKEGGVFMTMDNKETLGLLIDQMCSDGNIKSLTPEERKAFMDAPTFGLPFQLMKPWLSPDNADKRNEMLNEKGAGIPCDSTHDEFKMWIKAARDISGEGLHIAIKADASTSYSTIKKVMDSLRSIHENRYNLITSLKGRDD